MYTVCVGVFFRPVFAATTASKLICSISLFAPAHAGSSLADFLLPSRWRRYVPPKHRLTQYLHGATSQNTVFFIVTAVKTSNLKSYLRVSVEVTYFPGEFHVSTMALKPSMTVQENIFK
jgi:hypothetical protein